MTKWQYCELTWQPQGVTVTEFKTNGQHTVQTYAQHESPTLFAQLGEEGWEMTTAMASPAGIHEYWYYSKRPVAD